MADQEYVDIASLIGDQTDDAWEAMAESYAFQGFLLVAVLQRLGEARLPRGWFDLAQGFVVVSEPQPDGRVKVRAVRHGEVPHDGGLATRRLREKWERLYIRRDGVGG